MEEGKVTLMGKGEVTLMKKKKMLEKLRVFYQLGMWEGGLGEGKATLVV
jgi:hypothetical protein